MICECTLCRGVYRCPVGFRDSVFRSLSWLLPVYPVGFGQGPAGLSGIGFKLLVILFVEPFGVTFAQLIGAISPSIQIVTLFDPLLATVLTTLCGYPGICERAGSTTSILSLALWAG